MKTKIAKQAWTLKRTLPYILLIGGVVGVVCSFILTIDNINLLKNPGVQLNCDLNPIISCGSVMKTWQSSVFGFPNSIVGLLGFSFLSVVGLALLAGATFKRWFWLIVQASLTFAVGFTIWFQYQSFVNINALCPFCMAVWAITIPLFLYTTLYNLRENHIKTPAKLKPFVAFAQRRHDYLLAAWYLVIMLIILNHYWYYWETLL